MQRPADTSGSTFLRGKRSLAKFLVVDFPQVSFGVIVFSVDKGIAPMMKVLLNRMATGYFSSGRLIGEYRSNRRFHMENKRIFQYRTDLYRFRFQTTNRAIR